MSGIEVELLPALSDNYIFLLLDRESGTSGVVDPAEAGPVLARLGELGRGCDWIINTHHHGDHTAGNGEVKQATGAKIVGPAADAGRISGLDLQLREGDTFTFGSQQAKIYETPGHTSGHISYWFEEAGLLFSGDTLFALGCGRVFEGTMPQMHASLSKYQQMPDETVVYCGHEYTQSNARFALSVDPDNQALRQRAAEIDAMRQRGEPTVPTTLGVERRTNPFIRTSDPAIRRHLGMEQASDSDVFAEIRRRKDRF